MNAPITFLDEEKAWGCLGYVLTAPGDCVRNIAQSIADHAADMVAHKQRGDQSILQGWRDLAMERQAEIERLVIELNDLKLKSVFRKL